MTKTPLRTFAFASLSSLLVAGSASASPYTNAFKATVATSVQKLLTKRLPGVTVTNIAKINVVNYGSATNRYGYFVRAGVTDANGQSAVVHGIVVNGPGSIFGQMSPNEMKFDYVSSTLPNVHIPRTPMFKAFSAQWKQFTK